MKKEDVISSSTINEFEKAAKIASEIAIKAGTLLKSKFLDRHQISYKRPKDLVTEMDLASEKLIKEELLKHFPDDKLFGEETGGADFCEGRVWIFDPLDGTTNYAHGFPIFSVSIAMCIDGRPVAGSIVQPITGEVYYAWRYGGAYKNGEKIRVSNIADLKQALTVTGFPYTANDNIDNIMRWLKNMILRSQGVRRLGSAALDLCAIANGSIDVFWEIGLQPWDIAAGILLVEEAGGKVTNFSNKPLKLDDKELLATNSLLHEEALRTLFER